AGALRLADLAQAVLRPPCRVVRAPGRTLFRDVVGAGRTSARGRGGGRTARASESARPERPCLRLGRRRFGAIVEDGALRLRKSADGWNAARDRCEDLADVGSS